MSPQTPCEGPIPYESRLHSDLRDCNGDLLVAGRGEAADPWALQVPSGGCVCFSLGKAEPSSALMLPEMCHHRRTFKVTCRLQAPRHPSPAARPVAVGPSFAWRSWPTAGTSCLTLNLTFGNWSPLLVMPAQSS